MRKTMPEYISGLVRDYMLVIDNLSKEILSTLFNRNYNIQTQNVYGKQSDLENKFKEK